MSQPDIELYDPDVYAAGVPHEAMRWLREHEPVYWHAHPDGGGFWVISRHADVVAVSRDHRTFSAERGFVMVDDLAPEILAETQHQLLGMDPPRHGPIRRVVIERFTQRMLEQLEPKVREITRGILQRARAEPECEFVFDVAGHLPTAVICSLLAVPEDMWHQIREWSDHSTSASDPDIGCTPERQRQSSVEMGMYGYSLAAERRGKGGDDLISLLTNVAVEGRTVSEAEFASLFVQITVAGNETTRAMISTGMHELIARPALYRQLEQDPSGLPRAIEEMLRWSTPLHHFRRTATRDTELHGKTIRENDRVLMLYTSANFDERVFNDPTRFDITRDPNPHLAFGYGIHLCLGANLARLEARVFFEEFFRHFAGIEELAPPARIRS
ncbi:MAG: cytochrome P450, partial [Gammaproteobacteria bacterium]